MMILFNFYSIPNYSIKLHVRQNKIFFCFIYGRNHESISIYKWIENKANLFVFPYHYFNEWRFYYWKWQQQSIVLLFTSNKWKQVCERIKFLFFSIPILKMLNFNLFFYFCIWNWNRTEWFSLLCSSYSLHFFLSSSLKMRKSIELDTRTWFHTIFGNKFLLYIYSLMNILCNFLCLAAKYLFVIWFFGWKSFFLCLLFRFLFHLESKLCISSIISEYFKVIEVN